MARYWVGGSGTWDNSTTTHWASSSGGGGGASVPTQTDDVIIDSKSGLNGGTITITATFPFIHDFTSNSGFNYTIDHFEIFGDAEFEAGITFTDRLDFEATETGHTIKTNGCIFSGLAFTGSGGGWTLLDDLTIVNTPGPYDGSFSLWDGIFDANDHNITCEGVYLDTGSAPPMSIGIYMGSGTWTLTANDDNQWVWNTNGIVNKIVECETSTIKIVDTTSKTKKFYGGEQTYNKLWITGNGTGAYYIEDDNTFNELIIDTPPHTVYFFSSSGDIITTITTLTVNGSSGNNILFRSEYETYQYTISATNSNISFVDVQDCIAAGGIPFMDWYGKDSGNNVNWKFPFNGGSGQGATSKPQLKSVESKAPKFG